MTHCPAHDDRQPSLSVAAARDRVLVRCHAGCAQEAVLAALADAGLWGQRKGVGRLGLAGRLAERWEIRDADAALVAIHERWEDERGKRFVWWRPGHVAAGLHGLAAADLPLYGSERLAAWPADAPVLVVEGEKAADAARALGACALGTVTGAASAPGAAALRPLAGRDVALWPDADEPGARHMARLASALQAVGARVRMVRWEAAPPGGDAADFRAAGGTAEAQRALVASAAPWSPRADDQGSEQGAHDGPLALLEPLEPLEPLTPPAEPPADGPSRGRVYGEGAVTATADDRDVLRLADVTLEPMRWLWPGRVPLGKLTILDGDPGLGKSALTLDLAARVSRGTVMPDGSRADCDGPAGVVLLCAEDGLGDTIRPRLEAADADLHRVVTFTSVREGLDRRLVTLPIDCERLARTVAEEEARLVIVDPLMAFLDPAVNSYRDQDVRRALAPLVLLAQQFGVAVLVVRHLTKMADASPLYRGGGSIGIIGAARSGLLVAADPDDPAGQRRVLATVKGNLAAPADSLAYRLEAAAIGSDPPAPTVRLVWEGPTPHTAASLLAARHNAARGPESTAVAEAQDFLREALADAPRSASDVEAAARERGVSHATLKRARKALGVVAWKLGPAEGGGWRWALPPPVAGDDQGAQETQEAQGTRLEPLA
jgi:hypothetical protein